MLQSLPKTEQDSCQHLFQGAFLLPKNSFTAESRTFDMTGCGSLLFPRRTQKQILTFNRRSVNLKKTKKIQPPALSNQSRHHFSAGRAAYCAFLCVIMALLFTQPAYAATDVWSKAKEIMQDVYNQILLISTIAAIVTASVALLLMNFSRSGRTVDESRAWLKRICITWAILNGLGFIMAYVTPFFSGGKWSG